MIKKIDNKSMRERPIIFNDQMINEIMGENKTSTRRLIMGFDGRGDGRIKEIKSLRRSDIRGYDWSFQNLDGSWSWCRHSRLLELCPFGQVGDRLWVRETFGFGTRPCPFQGWQDGLEYKADEAFLDSENDILPLHDLPLDADIDALLNKKTGGWIPSDHMPRWASRITLEIADVRVSMPLTFVSSDDMAEGMPGSTQFFELWDSIYGEGNPFVWVIEFKIVDAK